MRKSKKIKEEFRFGFALLLFVLLFIILEYSKDSVFLKNQNWGLELQNRVYKERLQECKKYPLFEQVVSEIDSERYDLENYNCVDFSKDLVRKLETIGIKSNIAIDKDRTHAWVVIWIEAQTGEFVHPGQSLGLLELRNREMDSICQYSE